MAKIAKKNCHHLEVSRCVVQVVVRSYPPFLTTCWTSNRFFWRFLARFSCNRKHLWMTLSYIHGLWSKIWPKWWKLKT